jgi:uncharacterized protein
MSGDEVNSIPTQIAYKQQDELFLEYPWREEKLSTESENLATDRVGLDLQEMLLSVIRSMVDHPEDVDVELVSDEEGDVFQVEANKADLGRLIGKNGQTARALQLIVNANGRKTGRRFDIDFADKPEAEERS